MKVTDLLQALFQDDVSADAEVVTETGYSIDHVASGVDEKGNPVVWLFVEDEE